MQLMSHDNDNEALLVVGWEVPTFDSMNEKYALIWLKRFQNLYLHKVL